MFMVYEVDCKEETQIRAKHRRMGILEDIMDSCVIELLKKNVKLVNTI